MTKLITLIFIFILTLTFAQTNFDKGFSDGYKKGYCQDQGSCIEPIPPIAPIPGVYESSSNYQDGYNRGFQQGLNAQKNSNNSSTRTRYQTSKPNFIDFSSGYSGETGNHILDLKIKAINAILDRAKLNLENENYDDAIENSNDLLEVQPNLAIAYVIRSNAQFHKGELINAYNNSSKAINILNSGTPKDWYDFMNKEMLNYLTNLMSNSNYAKIIDVVDNFWYKNNLANYHYGLAYYYQNDMKKAKKYFKKCDELKRSKEYLNAIENNVFINNPFINDTKSNLNTTQNQENNQAKEYYDKIAKYYENRDYDKVIEMLKPFETAIENGKTNDPKLISFVFSNKAYCNYYLKNWKDCISDVTKSINSKENINPELYFIRAMAKSEMKDYYGANSDYDFLIDNYTTLNYKGNTLATLINNKAYNYVLLNDFKSATPLINRALSLDKNTDYIWGTKGELEYKLGNYTECVKAMDNALKIKETDNSYYYRGLANIKLGNKANGCKDLSKAGELGFSEAYNDINKYCK